MSYKQLIQSYIRICLNVSKPLFVLKEFVNLQQNSYNSEYITQITENQFAYVRIYDQEQKINKMLIICLSQDYQKYMTFYQEVTNRSIRSDLILNMLDHYYLDPDQIFYVFEMEQFNSTLDDIEKKYDLSMYFISKTKKQMTDYYNNSLHIFYKNYKYQGFFICITLDNQLKVKFNLIDHNWIIPLEFLNKNISDQEPSQVEIEVRCQEQLNTMEYEQELDGEKLQKMNDIPKMIGEFCESINIKIEKQDLLWRIQNNYSNVLKFHPLEIFKMIQSHPLYDIFQLNYSDEKEFELIVNKRGQIIILKGQQLSSLSQAEKLKDDYQFIILNEQLKNNSTILCVDLLMNENHCYVLTEKKFFYYAHRTTYNFANFNDLYLESHNQIINLCSFLYFSQKLLTEYNYQITKVNPQHLLFKDQNKISTAYSYSLVQTYKIKIGNAFQQSNQDGNKQYVQQKLSIFHKYESNKSHGDQKKLETLSQTKLENNNLSQKNSQKEDDLLLIKYLKENDVINLVIDQISVNDNQSEYTKIVNQSLKNNTILQDLMDQNFKNQYQKGACFKLIQLFFQKISENSIEEVVKIYNWLILWFDIINSIKNNKQYCFGQLSISNNDFRKVKVQMSDSYYFDVFAEINNIHKDIQISSLRIPVTLFKNIKQASKSQYFTKAYFKIIEEYIFMSDDNKRFELQNHFLQELIHLRKLTLYFENDKVVQFNLSGCKQITQLNLELYSQNGADDYDLTNIIKQIDQTSINKIKIFCTTFDSNYYDYKPKLTPFYKLKRLVNISIEEDQLEDTRSERDGSYSEFSDENFQQNLLKQNRSF